MPRTNGARSKAGAARYVDRRTAHRLRPELHVHRRRLQNRLQAESRVIRNAIWDWFSDVVMTRIEPGGSVFIEMTRWHPDDLAGRALRERREAPLQPRRHPAVPCRLPRLRAEPARRIHRDSAAGHR